MPMFICHLHIRHLENLAGTPQYAISIKIWISTHWAQLARDNGIHNGVYIPSLGFVDFDSSKNNGARYLQIDVGSVGWGNHQVEF